jgi:hypothetical protein
MASFGMVPDAGALGAWRLLTRLGEAQILLPAMAVAQIKGRVAFWKGVKVVE